MPEFMCLASCELITKPALLHRGAPAGACHFTSNRRVKLLRSGSEMPRFRNANDLNMNEDTTCIHLLKSRPSRFIPEVDIA